MKIKKRKKFPTKRYFYFSYGHQEDGIYGNSGRVLTFTGLRSDLIDIGKSIKVLEESNNHKNIVISMIREVKGASI